MWELPLKADIHGVEYNLNTDYRDILEILSYLESGEDKQTKSLIALALFYDDFDNMPESDYAEAWDYLMLFLNCGEPYDDTPAPKLIDWQQDYNVIAAEVNKAASCEVRSLPYMHWYTFIGYYNCIGEGQLSTIISIREKKIKGKKMEKWEREFYQNNKSRIDFKAKLTPEEQTEKERLLKLLS